MTATATRERPILFSGPMVKAILAGRKTQTRRLVKGVVHQQCSHCGELYSVCDRGDPWNLPPSPCPYGSPGEKLWVREAFAAEDTVCNPDGSPIVWYRADYPDWKDEVADIGGWRPSIHMPRWASRITLEIVSVRVERLREITEADAMQEGMLFLGGIADDWDQAPWADPGDPKQEGYVGPRGAFSWAWARINGKASWKANPWVWVITFKRLEATR